MITYWVDNVVEQRSLDQNVPLESSMTFVRHVVFMSNISFWASLLFSAMTNEKTIAEDIGVSLSQTIRVLILYLVECRDNNILIWHVRIVKNYKVCFLIAFWIAYKRNTLIKHRTNEFIVTDVRCYITRYLTIWTNQCMYSQIRMTVVILPHWKTDNETTVSNVLEYIHIALHRLVIVCIQT